MNRHRSFVAAVALVATTLAFVAPAQAASESDATVGRDLVKRYADSVVGVELVVTMKLKVGDREAPPREQRIEVNGTVVSSSGLTVTSLAEVDPQVAFDAIRASSPGGRGVELVGADFKEVKLRLADGKEMPARFVLKDADLDLAFMAPDVAADAPKPEFPAFVTLDNSTEGSVLGTYFSVDRAPKVLQRVPLVRTSSVVGIVEKPRRFYLMTTYALGTPMFGHDGKVLGITLQNFASGRRTGFVVLPSADIAEIAKQAAALQAQPKPPADKPAADTPAPAETAK